MRRSGTARRGIHILLVVLTLLLSVPSVFGTNYYASPVRSLVTVAKPNVILQSGNVANSTIYVNSTSASVTTPTLNYPTGYNVLQGTYSSGTLPASVNAIDSSYFVVSSTPGGATKFAETEFTFSVSSTAPLQLNFTVVQQFTRGSVLVTIQVFNYTGSSYPTSGQGYLTYTSSATANTDETKDLVITTNPQHYTSAGAAKVKIKAEAGQTFDKRVNFLRLFYYQTQYGTTTPTLNYPSGYNIVYGTYSSGTVPGSVNATDTNFFITSSQTPATQTLRPNAAGTYQAWTTFGSPPSHWQGTSDQSDTTGVETISTASKETQNLANTTATGTIQTVTAYIRALATGSGSPESAVILWRTYGTDYESLSINIGRTAFADYSEARTTNPNTGSAWTWAEVNALEIGSRAATLAQAGDKIQIAEYWIVVSYEPVGGITAETEFTFTVSTATPLRLNFTIVQQYTTASVSVTIQVYNYTGASYPTSGQGYLTYTSSATASTDETKTLTITTNPQQYTSAGAVKIKIRGEKSGSSGFDQKANFVRLYYYLQTFDYVLKIVNQQTTSYDIRLNAVGLTQSNIGRLSNFTVWLHDGAISVQLQILSGSFSTQTGSLYRLIGSGTAYLVIKLSASSSGVSTVDSYLQIYEIGTTAHTDYRLTFKIT